MEHNNDEHIIIHSYQDIWNYEKRIYTIGKNIKLPTPLSIREFGYMFVFFILLWIFTSIFKINFNPILYIIVPLILTKTVKFLMLDGKNPVIFIIDYIKYAIIYKQKTSFFEICNIEKIYFVWEVAYRCRRNTKYYIQKIDKKILEQLNFKYIDGYWLYVVSQHYFLCIENNDIYGIITRKILNDVVLDYEIFLKKLKKKSASKANELDAIVSKLVKEEIVLKF